MWNQDAHIIFLPFIRYMIWGNSAYFCTQGQDKNPSLFHRIQCCCNLKQETKTNKQTKDTMCEKTVPNAKFYSI
jgi:hypothetical protein